MVPQVLFWAPQVVLVQPQTKGVPGLPPPQVSGAMHAASFAHPHWPVALQALFTPQFVLAGSKGFEGVPPEQTSFVHRFPSTGTSVSSTLILVPPLPSQTTVWQSPAWGCIGVGVFTATFANPQPSLTHE